MEREDRALLLRMVVTMVLMLVFAFGLKHLLDTDFGKHPSHDLLDPFHD